MNPGLSFNNNGLNNFNGNWDNIVERIKQSINKILLGGCLMQACYCVLILLVLILAMFTPMLFFDNMKQKVQDTIDETVEDFKESVEKTWNFLTLNGFRTNEESFYYKLESKVKDYAAKGVTIDSRIVMSLLFYDEGINENEDFGCSISNNDGDDDESKECDINTGGSVDSGQNHDYGKLRSDISFLVDGQVDENGALKSEDDYKQWLKDNYAEDKLTELGYDIPSSDAQKDKMFTKFVETAYDKKAGYEEIFIGEEVNTCTFTETADEAGKMRARYTVYSSSTEGYGLGAIGKNNVEKLVKEGKMYLNNKGYWMIKGGTVANGKTWGQTGIDYLVVAAATKQFKGTTCGVNVGKNIFDDITYYNYGDTFSVQLTNDNGSSYDTYNAMVLDACGACMVFSKTIATNKCNGGLSTVTSNNSIKIDIFVDKSSSSYKAPADSGYFLSGNTSGVCVGQVDLGSLDKDYSKYPILNNKSLREVMGGDQGMTELNNLISSNVQKYGAGTGNGVAAAAISLLNAVQAKGYRLPYFWGGGHGTISTGANGNWGLKARIAAGGSSAQPAGSSWPNGLDCSGFVAWAIKNGGCTNYTGAGSSNMKSYGNFISFEAAKPGDLVWHPGHITLVVQNNNGTLTLAEAASPATGIHYTVITQGSNKNNKVIDMSGFYSSSKCK